jgi:hypothetical protein
VLSTDEQNALQLRSRLSPLLRDKLFAIMEEVFSEIDDGGILRIEKLEIDLGTISPDELEQMAGEKLKTVLREVLFKEKKKYTYLDTVDSGMEKLRHFLCYGYFPWWSDKQLSFKMLFKQMMDLHPQSLLELMQAFGRHEYVISRIVYQSEENLLIRLVQKLKFPFDRFILDYISNIKRTHQYIPLVQTSAEDFEKTIWKLALTSLFINRGTQFNKKAFIKWNIEKIAKQYGIKYELLLQFLADCCKKVSPDYDTGSSLMAIIDELNTESGSYSEDEPTDQHTLTSFENFLIHGHLIPAIADEYPSTIFEYLLKKSPLLIRQLIETLGHGESVQERIRKELPVVEVVRLVEPDEFEFIASYAAELQLSHQTKPVVKASSADFENVVWEFILNYLMKDRGSDFNRKSFIKWNLTQIASRYNTSYDRLLDFMWQSMQAMPASLRGDSSLSVVFVELTADAVHDEMPDPVIYYDRQQAFEILLSTGEFPWQEEVENAAAFLLQIIREHSVAVPRILRRLLYPAVHLSFTKTFSPALMLELVSTLMPATQQPPAALLKSIGDALPVSRNADALYCDVLRSILDGQPIDLDVLLSRYTQADIAPEGKTSAYFKGLLAGYFRRGKKPPAAILQEYMREYPADCRLFLFSMNSIYPDTAVLINDVEEIAGFLQPASASFLKEYMRWIDQAADLGLIPGGVENKERYHVMLLRYLLDGKQRIFNAASFLAATLPAIVGPDIPPGLDQLSGFTAPLQSMIGKAVGEKKESEIAVNREMAAAIFTYLLTGRKPKDIHEHMLMDCLKLLMDKHPLLVKRFFRKYLLKKEIRERWTRILPDNLLLRILSGSRYAGGRQIIYWMELFSAVIPAGLHWDFALKYVADTSSDTFNEKHFVKRFFSFVQQGNGGSGLLAKMLKREELRPSSRELLKEVVRPASRKPDFKWTVPKNNGEPLYILNAGLILLHPYFTRYFELLGLLSNKQFKDEAAVHKGIHALQYLVDQSTDTPESALPLNKLLCGYPLGQPVTGSVYLSDAEKNIGESLLKGTIQNWPMLNGSSTAALRTFLRREGKLTIRDERWDLEIENKTVDILIDHIPWSIAIIKQDWMEQTLYVKWRK